MRRKGTLPPESFRVTPFPESGEYFVVHVAPTLKEMHATMTACGEWEAEQVYAVVISASSKQEPGLLGVIYFAKDTLGVGIVAHEMAHAAFRACERRQMRVKHWKHRRLSAMIANYITTAESEETFCHVVERLNKEFWGAAYARGYA